jgi:hypothetical protein
MTDHEEEEKEEGTTEKCNDGVDSFRPSKLRRIILQSPLDHPMTTIQDSIVCEQVQCRMQDFVRVMMPSSRYTPDMDEFAQNCTDLLQNYTGHHDAEGNDLTTTTSTTTSSSMWEQLHGLLLLWLDYKITSCTPLDITTDDYRAVQSQLVVTTTCTCRCLLQVYRCCSPQQQQQRTPPRLCTMESLQLLVRTFLRIQSNHEATTTSMMTLMDWEGIAPLLRVIEMTIQQVDTRQLSCYTQLRFLLYLVQVATMTTTTTLDHSCTNDSLGLASSTARNILQTLGTGVMVTGLGWDPLRSFAEVAMQVVSNPNRSWGTMSSTTTSIQVFQIQCLLQRSSSTLHPEIVVVDIVPILVDKIFENCNGHSLNDLSQIQALDCIVTLAARYNQSSSSSSTKTLGDASYTALLEAFLRVLTEFESKADFELYLKGKATEGLQYLLELEDSLPHCINCLLLGSNKDTYKIKRFLSSLLDVSQVIHSQRTYGKECADDFIIDTSIFPMNCFVMAASEIVLSTLCWSLQNIDSNGMFIPLTYVVSVCDKFLQHNRCTNQHILYLTVHMICREQKTVFFSIVQTYPELLSALASLLKVDEDDHTGVTTKRLILTFFQDLLSTCPLFKTVVARQMGVVEAITYVADISLRQENENRSCHSLQEIAVQLLFVLSSDVFNRRIMARQSRVLPSMIRFVRGSRRDILTSESTNNTTSRTDNSNYHRETMKRCIAQLVAVL